MPPQIQKIMAFEKEIKEYEDLRRKYQTLIINKMDREEYIKYNEVLFSTFSCAIEGNSFSVDDTRELKECLIREKVVTFRMVKLNLLLSIFLITK